jgi:hypothetical protein
MKLFHKLLVAPATLGLLAPFSAVANEINVNKITQYGLDQQEIIEEEFDSNTFSRDLAQTNSDSIGDSTFGSGFEAGSFSESTVASFSADLLLGATNGEADTQLDSEATTATYSFEIGLNTSFTGEDDLFVKIGSGNTVATNALTSMLDFGNANSDQLKVKDLHYTRPFGEKLTVSVGDSMDLSKQFAGACAYSGFTDSLADCGTGNSAGAGGDVTVSASYDIGNGFTFGAGLSGSEGSTTDGLFTKESNDLYGMQIAYGADNYGAAVSYSNSDTPTTDTVYWGLNAYYSFGNEFLDSISVGYEAANPTAGEDSQGFFVGLTSGEVGPGAFSVAMGTNDDVNGTALITDDAETTYLYELSYGWDINDQTSATFGGFIQERTDANGLDLTGIAFSTSFAF